MLYQPKHLGSYLLRIFKIVLVICCGVAFQGFAQVGSYKYCVDPDWMPYEALVSGQHKGISKEYKKLFEQYANLTFELVETKSWKQTTEFLKAGKCQLTFMLNRSDEREQYLSFSLPYFFGPNVLVTTNIQDYVQNLSSVGDQSVGVVKGYRLVNYIDRFHPNINKTLLSSEQEGLQKLAQGDIDVYVGSLLSITNKLKQPQFDQLKINGWIAVQDELRIGVIKPFAATLIPKLNAAIEQIPTQVHNDIFHRWSNTQIVTTPDYALVIKVSLTAIVIFILIGWRYRVSTQTANALRRKNRELEELQQKLERSNKKLEYISYHDNLTGLYNRHYFLTTFQHFFKDVERQGHDAALMLIDIDYFKQINDKYGHNAGDSALEELGKLLRSTLRSGDIPARWGGEEFTVLMPSTTQEEVLQVANRLQQTIKNQNFATIGQMTVSIGVAQYTNGDTIHSWIERTDKALYEAKEHGRNRIRFYNQS